MSPTSYQAAPPRITWERQEGAVSQPPRQVRTREKLKCDAKAHAQVEKGRGGRELLCETLHGLDAVSQRTAIDAKTEFAVALAPVNRTVGLETKVREHNQRIVQTIETGLVGQVGQG